MTLRIYNTLTRTKEAFEPLDPKNVRMYVCGPTVYDFAHIGNARPAIVFDVMYRLLRHLYGESHVTYVRNITDVDDKINARALRDYPSVELNDAIRRVTETTYDQYQKDVAALGCLPPTVQPRATEHIAGMVEMIRVLINRGHAYEAGGEVLFSVGSMADYGKLSGRKLEDQQAGARVAVDAHKKNPGDFVLWKQSSAEEPGWESPWGRGRPGWHIECSVMSRAHLGEVFDIHGGGLDLIFPHHENEIAQSRCAHGTEAMARYWMHNGFLQVEGKKMSKSDGNFVTISGLLETEKFGGRKWPGAVLRFNMLRTHYRQPIDWSVKALEESFEILDDFFASTFLDNLERQPDEIGPAMTKFVAALREDMNTPLAISVIQQGRSNVAKEELAQMIALLGIDLRGFSDFKNQWQNEFEGNNAGLDQLIQSRLEVRKAKNWAESDRIRDELLAMGIQIKDVKDPVTGEMKTEWEVKR
jgi:cysteinyl-tRNA synthetase